MLNDDVLRIIDSYCNMRCEWCQSRISIFSETFLSIDGYYFCDVYCAQYVENFIV